MYNRAYAYYKMGKKEKARTEMENALKIAAESSESRHKFISAALDKMRVRDWLPLTTNYPLTNTLFSPTEQRKLHAL